MGEESFPDSFNFAPFATGLLYPMCQSFVLEPKVGVNDRQEKLTDASASSHMPATYETMH